MSKSFGSKQIIPILSGLLGVVFLWVGLSKFGFWITGTGPTPAFVPSIISVLLIVVSILAFFQSFKEKEKPQYHVDNFKVIGGAVSIFATTFIIGLLPAVALYVLLWLKLLEKTPWKQTLMCLGVIMAIVIGVFVLWLRVPFPMGIIYDTFFY